ncbi:NAD-glutamate dehydrogenase domain-containing protein [Paludibacterium denitrificans]|uniref:NAD-glutamate dehydrogenase domain-containing protein n=1 Tax=Paludibacterium denitrificans TaxID=2675226 RepID=UPI0028A9B7C6|nr:NAD-glutamate dehydrogenase domain-containing protein [Paludibacterium denitrificans]
MALFVARLHPLDADATLAETLLAELRERLDNVANLDEDRILNGFLAVILAIRRSNFWQQTAACESKPYLSFKLESAAIPFLPQPRPLFEIWVYSPRVEGVHLRGAKVARGGLRWSDRMEDFRTEVLGLVKAQMVKNSVIVPMGSKGGFVCKQLPLTSEREAFMAEGIACYKIFISGLLDLTDNLVAGQVVPPPHVRRLDADDPYLVVAADKGTATFSDIANGVSADYDFWLGDAFASGGSAGYDHKGMGITARGAREAVKRHFRHLGKDIQNEDFTVIGIGDMAGDVFGNGMLLSKHIRLKAAFNHQHIFIDPNPDAAISYAERCRLFQLPRSSWADYNRECISAGGGIFERSAKSIPLSAEVKAWLNTDKDSMAPLELINNLLKAEADLLYNGGIGTYVKASTESHADARDRANDGLRVNGNELRVKVVGEGGNPGLHAERSYRVCPQGRADLFRCD